MYDARREKDVIGERGGDEKDKTIDACDESG
jgi:hypothetical protein